MNVKDYTKKFLNALDSSKPRTINVSDELKQIKKIRDRLQLAKQQQCEIITNAECAKINNEVDKQEAISKIEADCNELDKLEDVKIEEAEGIIEEADEWLSMFPTKK